MKSIICNEVVSLKYINNIKPYHVLNLHTLFLSVLVLVSLSFYG